MITRLASVGLLVFVSALLMLPSAACASATFLVFRDPSGPLPLPIGIGAADFSWELTGIPEEDIYPCSPTTKDCIWPVEILGSTFDKGEAKLYPLGLTGRWTELLEDSGLSSLLELYQEGLTLYMATPSGQIKEELRVQLESEGSGDAYKDWLLFTYLNAGKGMDFGKVPVGAWQFGRSSRYTSFDPFWVGVGPDGFPVVTASGGYVGALTKCDLCVVIYRTPEPGSLALLALGFAGLRMSRRKAVLKEIQ